MEPFWKSLTECKLLPLTTDFFPEQKDLNNVSRYLNDLSLINEVKTKTGLMRTFEDFITEYICLRLTQNFQLILTDPNPVCVVDYHGFINRINDIKMCFGNKFDVLSSQNKENMQIKIFTKNSEESLSVKHADFKYLLFNFHTNKF